MKWWISVGVLAIAISLASARGGRGGGGGARSSSGGRYGGSSSRSYRSAFSGNRLSSSSSIRSALLLGTVYGATSYRVRARYRADGTLPEICYNDSYNMSTNGTVSYQGRFFCPIDENMSEDYRYCCGEEGQQYCCRFWDSPGRVVGVVVGILLGVVALFVVVFCVIKHIKSQQRKSRESSYSAATANGHSMYPPPYNQNPPSYEMANTYSDQKAPIPTSNIGFTPYYLTSTANTQPYPATTAPSSYTTYDRWIKNIDHNETWGQKY
uniref:Uncharacterized protein LOC111119292 isoform X2 n=1 Tax=Crassostrea virginica TaxID=6565 RepID=A0A8B8CH41_CRAVI|nr:uncharacterized protein LOC111119292 isoform X2 [Crassostrea virginica]